MIKPNLIVIAGPTASGKTTLAVECAKRFNGEVISADSMQIYKGMDIATAKPSKEEMKGVKHHLLDFLPVDEAYSVAEFVNDANIAAQDIISRNKLPIIAGGTGLYIDSFVNNLSFTESDTDLDLRKELNEKIEKIGAQSMLSELAQFDSETASKLHPSNKKRIVRAFEVYLLTGKTFSQTVKESKNNSSPFDISYFFINYRDRNILYDKINRRVDLMLENGLLNEAEEYFNLPKKATASQAIGYKEFRPYFNGEISYEKAVENLKQSTRHYAKRQITWFNKSENTIDVFPDDYDSTEQFCNAVFSIIEKVI